MANSNRENTIRSIAQQIKYLRGEMSQVEFAKKIGKPQSIISRMECLNPAPNVSTLLDVIDKLGLPLCVKFGENPVMEKIVVKEVIVTIPEKIISRIESVVINGEEFIRKVK